MLKTELNRIIIFACIVCCTIQLSNSHHQFNDYYSYRQQPQPVKSGGNSIISVILAIAFICLCGFGCVYCCRSITNRNNNNTFPPNNQYNPNIAAPRQNYPPYPPVVNYQPQPIYSQRVGQIPSNPSASMNPYIVENERASQINKICDLCNIKSKIGEQPRILVNCPSQHFFHLSCIGSAIRPPNIICPRCGETCLQRVTLFCSSCKQSNVVVNLSEFMYQTGELDIDALKAKYGEICPKCINQ